VRFGTVGAGWPMDYHLHQTVRVLSVPQDAIPTSVRDAVTGIAGQLESLCDTYLGTQWNGHNHVGQWSDDAVEIRQYIEDHWDPEIDCTMDPDDWFGDDWDQLARDVQSGLTPEQIVDASDHTDGHGNQMINRDNAVRYIRDHLDELMAEGITHPSRVMESVDS